mmetsp:Transcript_30371/g.98761  ORF Transcript_30371/g.98761 Transcript_30371/m.98761 type:complete len:126 (+) Transcript_30371:35-412(+)
MADNDPFATNGDATPSGAGAAALSSWRAEQNAMLDQKVAKEREVQAKLREEAVAEKERFYEQRQTTIAATMKTNREREAAQASAPSENTWEATWEAVLELVDLESKGESRMKELFFRLKRHPIVH